MQQPLTCQRDLFQLDEKCVFLNGAYMSPQLKSVEAAGLYGIIRKNTPNRLSIDDFFNPVEEIKKSFAQLIDAPDHERVAIVPSVSYGLSTVANNVKIEAHQNIVLPGDVFPSNYYCWKKLCDNSGAELRMIERPVDSEDTTASWNAKLLEAIDENTILVSASHVHWADGTLWDLKAIRKKTTQVGALLIIDGTQSTGALPFSIREINPDALISASYKWLMGPYSMGYAYFGEAFDNGSPIEESWVNRMHSDDFRNLVNYQSEYRPKAIRYCVGEHSNFVMLPMLQTSLDQLNAWEPARIQAYCKGLWDTIIPDLNDLGIHLSPSRAHHLVGLRLPPHINLDIVQKELVNRNIAVSLRGDAIRVAPNVYNTPGELQELVGVFRKGNQRTNS